MGMNFVFFSPHFPANGADFCDRLKKAGATVLGIGDASYDELDPRLKKALSEYYRLADMESYDAVLRAVGHFIHKWGRIDRFESLNEHWLELEAGIRTDFNIPGTKLDFVKNLKNKSRMRAFFRKSGVETIPQHKPSRPAGALNFTRRVGYPVVVKPDSGAGARDTFKITNAAQLEAFFRDRQDQSDFVMEKFVDGLVVTYDGLVDIDGEVVLATSTRYNQSIMDVVNSDGHMSYVCQPEVDPKVDDAGRKILQAFDVRERFFHIELFETRDGNVIALEVNMRPPGAWITDAINFTYDIDVYGEWANMVVNDRVGGPFEGKYFTAYASRKNRIRYRHDHQAVLAAHGSRILRHSPIERIFSRAMGDYAYQMRSTDPAELREIVRYIHEEAT
jgi:biotin carboxylase